MNAFTRTVNREAAPKARDTERIKCCEVTFVFPCLDEAATIGACVRAAQRMIEIHGLDAEIVVADNGSSDGSVDIALRAGARVVRAPRRGYGSAISAGVAGAMGRYVIMADSDGSYDVGESVAIVNALRAGADLVVGSRFKGRILPGAMPWKNRYIGNPLLTAIGRRLFGITLSDFHCGLRGFSTASFRELDLRCDGMEFASEIIVKAALAGHRMEECAATLYPDGRGRPSHLRPWSDGWRHLCLLLQLRFSGTSNAEAPRSRVTSP